MSNRVGIRELRQQASALLRRVMAGEVLEITEHGHPIARLVPLRPSTLDQLVLEGRASEADGDLIDLMDELGLPVAADARSHVLSDALAELRADER
jgi:prevent-host-death family protein